MEHVQDYMERTFEKGSLCERVQHALVQPTERMEEFYRYSRIEGGQSDQLYGLLRIQSRPVWRILREP